MRFRALLTLSILLPLMLTATAIIAVMYLNADRRSADMAHQLLTSVTDRAAQQIRDQSRHAVSVAHMLRSLAQDELALSDSDCLVGQLLGLLRANPGITWIAFSDTEGTFTGAYRDADGRLCTNQSRINNGKTSLVEYVVGDGNTRTLLKRDPDSGYDPRTRPFFIEAARRSDVVWLDPYVFYGQEIPGITCAVAIQSPGNQLRGVFSVDYDLNMLSEFARSSVVSDHSQVMVFTADHVLIAHSSLKIVKSGGPRNSGKLVNLEDVGDPVTDALQRNLPGAELHALRPGESRLIPFPFDGRPYLACVMAVQLASGPLQYVAAVAPRSDFAPTPWQSSRNAFLIVAAALALTALVVTFMAYSISKPLLTLVTASERIGKGDFNVEVDLGPLYEFKLLARAFHDMQVNLRDWVRVRTSINLAMEIQRRLLPAGPPKVPGFDIAGFSAYCDETGGDYYDYIVMNPVAPQQFVVALGDVMGHGLPSALLMAGARGILRSGISACPSPAALLSHINTLLYRDTDGNRFMTMCLVNFNLISSKCVWASAGHDPPIIYDPHSGTFYDPEGGDVPLGVLESVDYVDYPFGEIAEGQIIFLGSDGVWESYSPDGTQFGKDRIKTILAEHAGKSAAEIQAVLLAALETFRANLGAKDDVTFVIMKILPSGDSP